MVAGISNALAGIFKGSGGTVADFLTRMRADRGLRTNNDDKIDEFIGFIRVAPIMKQGEKRSAL
jgi:hypothetical protein